MSLKKGGKVLVTYDGSKGSKAALDAAVELAKKANGSVTLLFIYWDPTERKSDKMIESIENAEEDQGSRVFRDIEKELRKAGANYDLRAEQYDDVAKGILDVARGESFDMIAIGQSGAGGKKQGSIYRKIKEKSKIPLLVM